MSVLLYIIPHGLGNSLFGLTSPANVSDQVGWANTRNTLRSDKLEGLSAGGHFVFGALPVLGLALALFF